MTDSWKGGSSRRSVLVGAGGAMLATLMGGSALAADATPRRGGTLTVVLRDEPTTLNVIGSSRFSTRYLSSKISDGLLSFDFGLNPKPQLATEWHVSPDALEYTFKLRRGVKWHDGKDFTSADVAYSIALYREKSSNGPSLFGSLKDILTPDEYGVKLVLSQPNLAILPGLSSSIVPIVPKHLFEGRDFLSNPANTAPVGTGPFVLKEWVQGSHIVLERNPNYWDAPKPYLDRIIFRIIADGPSASIGFETGQIDIGGYTPVPRGDLNRLLALPHLAADKRGYGYSGDFTQLAFNLESRYLKNVDVRHAIAHAIDPKVILKTAWLDQGAIIHTPLRPELSRYLANDVPKYPFDTRKAEALLDKAGFPRGEGGMRFRLTHDPQPSGEAFINAGVYLRQALRKVGIELTNRSQDFPGWLKRVWTDRDFDLAYLWPSLGYDPSKLETYYLSSNFRRGLTWSNFTGYQSPEADALLLAARVEGDPRKRADYYKDWQRVFVRDLPAIDLVAHEFVTLYNKRVRNHTVGAFGLFENLAQTYLEG